MGHSHLWSFKRRERAQSCSSATALEWGPARMTCLLCTAPLVTSKLAYGEPWGCCLLAIQIKDLSSCHLVHVPPSSVSKVMRARMCSQTWGLWSASRGPLGHNVCMALGKLLTVTVAQLLRCKMGALQLSLPVLTALVADSSEKAYFCCCISRAHRKKGPDFIWGVLAPSWYYH